MERSFYYFSTLALSALFFTSSALAAHPLPPRFSGNGYASDYVVGQMDLMIPVSGDRLQHTYFNPAIAYGSDNQGYADLGLGHRWIHNCQTLLGVYLFGGYTRTEHDAHLWVANPGIEAMGRRWDAHLNGYLSMGDKNYHYLDGQQGIGTFFRGHSGFITEEAFNLVHHTGNGADLKLGYQLFSHVPLRAYLGGYYFRAHEVNRIGGGVVGLEYWLDDHIKSFAHYTYDNLHHSTGAIGLGIELGGTRYHRSNPCIEERLTDPVERYLAELGHGSALPGKTKKNFIGSPYSVEILNNIAFFTPNGIPNNSGEDLTIDNCTYENPCGLTDFLQNGIDTLNTLLPGTIMYFNGNYYPALNNALNSPITLRANQSIYSRNKDYSMPANKLNRSIFLGGFIFEGNNLINDIILLNNNASISPAITANGVNNYIINSSIGDPGKNNQTSYEKLIAMSDDATLIINASQLFSSGATGGNMIALNNDAKLLINNSQISITKNSGTTATTVNGIGLLDSNNYIEINNSDLQVYQLGTDPNNITQAVAITSGSGTNDHVTITDSLISTESTRSAIALAGDTYTLANNKLNSSIIVNNGSLFARDQISDSTGITGGTTVPLNITISPSTLCRTTINGLITSTACS